MVLFNYSTRELTAKIVYYGPGLCGKTTNLQYIYNSLPESVRKGKMLSLATKTDRTLFFDFLPIELGTIRGMRTRVQLYTVPGQVFYNSTRKLVLKGADGVVFVADSQSKMVEANIESYRNLEENLREMGIRLEEIPLVMQFNKRDLPNMTSIEEMNTRINRHNAPFYEAVAMTGIGVEDTLKAITKLVLNNLSAKYRIEEGTGTRHAAAEPAAPGSAAAAPAASASMGSAPAGAAHIAGAAVGGIGPVDTAVPAPARTEDLALDALDADEPAMAAPFASPGPSDPAPALATDQDSAEDDVIDLVEEVEEEAPSPAAVAPMPAAPEVPAAPRSPATVTLHPAALRGAPARPAPAPMAVATAAALDRDPFEEDDPIDLDEPVEVPLEAPPVSVPLAIGPLAAGEEREAEVPVSIDLGGRTLQVTLKLKVRLSG